MSYNEIRQTISKKNCLCAGCSKPISEGSLCVVDPKNRRAYCPHCGKSVKTEQKPKNDNIKS